LGPRGGYHPSGMNFWLDVLRYGMAQSSNRPLIKQPTSYCTDLPDRLCTDLLNWLGGRLYCLATRLVPGLVFLVFSASPWTSISSFLSASPWTGIFWFSLLVPRLVFSGFLLNYDGCCQIDFKSIVGLLWGPSNQKSNWKKF